MIKEINVLIYYVAVLVQIYINSIGGPDLGPGNALTGKQWKPTDREATGANGSGIHANLIKNRSSHGFGTRQCTYQSGAQIRGPKPGAQIWGPKSRGPNLGAQILGPKSPAADLAACKPLSGPRDL